LKVETDIITTDTVWETTARQRRVEISGGEYNPLYTRRSGK